MSNDNKQITNLEPATPEQVIDVASDQLASLFFQMIVEKNKKENEKA